MIIAVDPSNVVVPFKLERVYFVVGATGERGGHAHHCCQQFAFCAAGACTFVLDDGTRRWKVRIGPSQGIMLPPYLWHEMKDFTSDCVLTVMASEAYNEADYIREYSEFKTLLGLTDDDRQLE